VDARIYSEEAILDSSHTCKFEQWHTFLEQL
jgi:hypothetical protein